MYTIPEVRGQGLCSCISGLSLRAWALGFGAQESRAMRRWQRFLKVRDQKQKMNEVGTGECKHLRQSAPVVGKKRDVGDKQQLTLRIWGENTMTEIGKRVKKT